MATLGDILDCVVVRLGRGSILLRLPDNSVGRVPAQELSWGLQPINPAGRFHLGQGVRARVHHVSRDGSVTLSIRRVERDPWESAEDAFRRGKVVRGRVVSIEDFGAFVECDDAPGLVGLVHISEIGPARRYEKPEDAVLVGDHVEATVTSVDAGRRRLSLSIRERLQAIARETGRYYGEVDDLNQQDTLPAPASGPAATTDDISEEALAEAFRSLRERALGTAAGEEDTEHATSDGRSILVVDDEAHVRTSWCEILRIYGYRTSWAESGQEALACIGRECPDIVLLDVSMTPMSGLEVLRSLSESHPELPVILMTGGDVSLGMDEFRCAAWVFRKPFTEQELVARLEQIFDETGLTELPTDWAAESGGGPGTRETGDRFGLGAASRTNALAEILEMAQLATGADLVAFFEVRPAVDHVSVVASRGPFGDGWRRSHERDLYRSAVHDVVAAGRTFVAWRSNPLSWRAVGPLEHLADFSSCVGAPVPGGSSVRYALFAFFGADSPTADGIRSQITTYAGFARAIVDAEAYGAALDRASNLLQLGQMAGQLVHEVANHLQALGRRIGLAAHHLKGPSVPNVERNLASAVEIVTDLEEITNSFVSGTEGVGRDETCNVGKSVTRAVGTMGLLLGDFAAIRLEGPVLRKKAGIGQNALHHVLTNLILNAAQQISVSGIQGGTVSVSAAYTDNARYPIKILVRDSGPGIHAYLGEQIFERAYTTRSDGAGLGLGVCRRLITSGERGEVQLEDSVVFVGSTFAVTLAEADGEDE